VPPDVNQRRADTLLPQTAARVQVLARSLLQLVAELRCFASYHAEGPVLREDADGATILLPQCSRRLRIPSEDQVQILRVSL